MTALLMGVLSPLLLGYCVVRFLAPTLRLSLQFSLGAGVGAGILSCLFFISRVVGILPLIPETAALAAAALYFLKKGPAHSKSSEPWTRGAWLFGAVFALTAAIAIVALVSTFAALPHGPWDATAIWNLRARFLASPTWRDGFSPFLLYSHPDYPLLVPAAVARIWMVTRGAEFTAPVFTATLFAFATVALLVCSLATLKSRAQGFAAGILLVSTHFFVMRGASEYADVPISFYLLAALALFALTFRAESEGLSGRDWRPVLAGLTIGLAVWTKNEGWMLVVAAILLCTVLLWKTRGSRESYHSALLLASAGFVPVLLLCLYFQYAFPSPNPFVGGRSLENLTLEIASPERYRVLGQGLLDALSGTTDHKLIVPVLGAALCGLFGAGFNRESDRSAAAGCALVLAIVFAGYCATVIISPWEIHFQVASALDRLLLQLLPGALFAAFLALPAIE